MRFLHIADVHLGYRQYNSEARYDDFKAAFDRAVNLALEREVEVCLVAGDLFHKADIDPLTLYHAEVGLQKLQDAGITTLAVHGNHDKVRYRDRVSWIDYLNRRGLLKRLEPRFEEGSLALEEGHSYVDLGATRFIGVPWLGAAAAAVLADVAGACERLPWDGIAFTVLITHAGVEGQMPDLPGCLTYAQLEPLKKRINYLALGHLHKPYDQDDWIYNPGALETCAFDEADFRKGVYLVDVGPDGTPTADHIRTEHRSFINLPFHTDIHHDPAALLTALREDMRRSRGAVNPDDGEPVVRLVLQGNLTFDRAQLDLEEVRRIVWDEIGALLVRVENRARPLGFDAAPDEGLSRPELERAVFENLALSDTRYSTHAAAWGRLMRQIKHLVLDHNAPDAIFAALDQHMAVLEDEGA